MGYAIANRHFLILLLYFEVAMSMWHNAVVDRQAILLSEKHVKLAMPFGSTT